MLSSSWSIGVLHFTVGHTAFDFALLLVVRKHFFAKNNSITNWAGVNAGMFTGVMFLQMCDGGCAMGAPMANKTKTNRRVLHWATIDHLQYLNNMFWLPNICHNKNVTKMCQLHISTCRVSAPLSEMVRMVTNSGFWSANAKHWTESCSAYLLILLLSLIPWSFWRSPSFS